MTARPSLARAWALLATALLAPLLIGSPAAAADDPPALASFGISGAADGAPDQRSSLNVTAAPGSVLHDFVAILNQTDAQIDLEVYATDALNTADGAVGLPDRATAPHRRRLLGEPGRDERAGARAVRRRDRVRRRAGHREHPRRRRAGLPPGRRGRLADQQRDGQRRRAGRHRQPRAAGRHPPVRHRLRRGPAGPEHHRRRRDLPPGRGRGPGRARLGSARPA